MKIWFWYKLCVIKENIQILFKYLHGKNSNFMKDFSSLATTLFSNKKFTTCQIYFTGFYLAPPWFLPGPSLVIPWSLPGPSLAPPWSLTGPSLVPPWSLPGPSLVRPCSLPGSSLVPPWSFPYPSLVPPWPLPWSLPGDKGLLFEFFHFTL